MAAESCPGSAAPANTPLAAPLGMADFADAKPPPEKKQKTEGTAPEEKQEIKIGIRPAPRAGGHTNACCHSGHRCHAAFFACSLASVLQGASHAKLKRAGSPGSRTPGRHPLKLTHRRWLITDPASQTIADGGASG